MQKHLTKYFSSEALPFISEGSFRFGTLESYRATESQPLARMSDEREGLIQQAIHPKDGYIAQGKLGTIEFKNVSFQNCSVPILLADPINDFIFCASIGGYDRSHHEQMLEHNPDLTEYAVLDLDLFLKGVRFSAPHQTQLKPTNHEPWLLHNIVKYESPRFDHFVSSNFSLEAAGSPWNLYLKTVFHKPERFSIEREYRVVIRPYAPKCLPPGAPCIALKHRKLLKSIVIKGSI